MSTFETTVSQVRADVQLIQDHIAIEEPLEIICMYLDSGKWVSQTIGVVMRTPGDDERLCLGYMYSEGIIRSAQDIDKIDSHPRYTDEDICVDSIYVQFTTHYRWDKSRLDRKTVSGSSCGICGHQSIDHLFVQYPYTFKKDHPTVSSEYIRSLPDLMKKHQLMFKETGGVHACGLYSSEGKLIHISEDIGRHNALDKLIGFLLENPSVHPRDYIVVLSGRAGFEMVQKTLAIGIPVILAVGAPTSLAVQMSRNFSQTLCGFVRKESFNIYSAPERIVF